MKTYFSQQVAPVSRVINRSNVNSKSVQLMTVANGNMIVGNVRAAVPNAANRFGAFLKTLGKNVDRGKLTDDILASPVNNHPFASTSMNDIVPRAQVARITNGAVCDNYQEMVVAEIDRNPGLLNGGDVINRENYPGHSYVSISNGLNAQNDLILDAWRGFVDQRRNFTVFSKYSNPALFNKWAQVPVMNRNPDWMNDEGLTRNFLNTQGINTNVLADDMETYMNNHPGRVRNRRLYLY